MQEFKYIPNTERGQVPTMGEHATASRPAAERFYARTDPMRTRDERLNSEHEDGELKEYSFAPQASNHR